MTMNKSILILVFSLLIFSVVGGCTSNSPTAQTKETLPNTILHTKGTDSKGDPIKEFGLLAHVEDSGYPFFTLTVDFQERQFEASFLLNIEEVAGWDAGLLAATVGKYVSFEYFSEVTNALLDLKYQGKSLLGDDGLGVADEYTKSVTGVLSGAEQITAGDTPGMLFISTREEYFETFDFFITPEIVAANGKVVEGVYEQRTRNTIVSLEVKD